MGKITSPNQPCISPECGSHDARQIYEDGTSYCFSCKSFFPVQKEEGFSTMTTVSSPRINTSPSPFVRMVTLEEVASFASRGLRDRAIEKVVCEFFDVRVSYDTNGNIDTHYYPYKHGDAISYKSRKLPKTFQWIGPAGTIFGYDKFSGGGKRLVITEGEIDALSVAQAHWDKYKKIYPVVALPSATSVDKLLEHREWIRSFEEVVIMMDNDEAGEVALKAALKIVGIDKARVVTYPTECKDAGDVLVKLGAMRLMQVIWDSQQWSPAGIVRKDALWESLVNYNSLASIPYPPCMSGVNTKLKGMRLGEIALFISGTGSGKSTLLREIMIHLENHPDVPKEDKIGVISLEEAPAETARKLAGMAINRNPANEEIPIEDLKVGFDKVFGDDRILLLDHQGSIADGSIVDQLEYMALVGCKYLFIDHITILVSEGADGLSGNEAIDKVMNDLLRLVKRHNVWIGLVSHLRKAPVGGKSFEEGKLPNIDDIRGSGSIKQISFDILAFARNMSAEDEVEKNTIKMAVLKSRYTGLTGGVKGACYDNLTGRLRSAEGMPQEQFTKII